MTVPERADAASLLLSLHPNPRLLRHSRAVAEVAGWLAARIQANGIAIDRRLSEAGGLLHDVDKALPGSDPVRALRHGYGSAAWLRARGYQEVAPVVADHPVTRLADDADFERLMSTDGIDARVVAYADKRAAQRLGPMSARFASWARRYPARRPPELERLVRDRAARLEEDVCRAAGVEPAAVARLRWTASALAAAAQRASGADQHRG
jgi:putative nucleotidyltransferase with HDIG domain